jgi:hypothetical protein
MSIIREKKEYKNVIILQLITSKYPEWTLTYRKSNCYASYNMQHVCVW